MYHNFLYIEMASYKYLISKTVEHLYLLWKFVSKYILKYDSDMGNIDIAFKVFREIIYFGVKL